jgi:hypothetical protein
MNTRTTLLAILGVLTAVFSLPAAEQPGAELVEARQIWDRGGHNAFTDLVRFQERWFCVFREAKSHVSPDGALRIITSADGQQWDSAALLTSTTSDLRDGKLSECLKLPSGGDTSYAGLVLHEGLLWVSYYSSHEGKTSIYLAKVRLPKK